MTRDEIMAMKPGRGMDGLVYLVANPTLSGIVLAHSLYPVYSTDIFSAWSLMEEMVSSSNEVIITGDANYFEGRYMVEVMADGTAARECGDTAPEAICKAYLLWKGEGGDGR